jgi:hypothetical protein
LDALGFAPLAPAHAEWFQTVKTKQAAVPMHYGTKVGAEKKPTHAEPSARVQLDLL